jgi:peptidoglycan hydrolase CwlO-like protein
MKNIVLLLVLVAGLLAGYFVGDYRGKDAREALKMAIETGKTLESERETTITQLKTELESINEKHLQEISAIRKNNDAKVAEWRRTKESLENTLKLTTAKLAASDGQMKSLVSRRDGATGEEKARLDLEIEQLKKQQASLRQEIEGGACLQARVPHSVFDALNETIVAGAK